MELKNFIWKFVSKDKFKPAMCGVYMDPEEKAAVATDAHVMLVCHELCNDGKIISDGGGNDWLNEHHFDYRDLIEKGLALEAPEGMYNIK